ncbi:MULTISPECIES: hypothetical protein [unclassified Streptomyces]
MTSFRRNALRAVLGVVAAITLGLIGATTASAQPAPGDIVWHTANDIVW